MEKEKRGEDGGERQRIREVRKEKTKESKKECVKKQRQ